MEVTLTLSLDEINNLIELFKSANSIIELREREIRNEESIRMSEWFKAYQQLETDIYESSTTIENLMSVKKDMINDK